MTVKDIIALCEKHPHCGDRELTIDDWYIQWEVNRFLTITDLGTNKIIMHANHSSVTGYVTHDQLELMLNSQYKNKKHIVEKVRRITHFIYENLKHYPNAAKDVLRFIGEFIYADPYQSSLVASCLALRATFTKDYSFYFAVMLSTAFTRGEMYLVAEDKEVVWVDTNGVAYDVEGVVDTTYKHLHPLDSIGDAIDKYKRILF